MTSSKFIKVLVVLYGMLFVRWIYKASVPFLSDNNFIQYSVDGIRSKIRQKTPQSLSPPSNSDTGIQYKALIIGYGKFAYHTFPEHCQCDQNRFYVTNDTRGVLEADVVIFTVGARRNMTDDTWQRYHNQRRETQLWVLGTRESPLTNVAVRPPVGMINTYNLSFTYHSKSNFPTPYGRFTKFDSPQYGVINWFSRKSKLIQWTSSHCPLSERHYPRKEFVYKLRQYLDITMYGTCGDGRFDGDDYLAAAREYKFTLTLENSCCSEYISEKFWDALLVFNSVPVVYGATREEYERIAPPNSFIFLQDFSTLQELANYIMEVGSNELKYNEYHNWRRLGYGTKQRDPEDRIYHCESVCRLSNTVSEARAGKKFQFDEKSDVFFGGCRNCRNEIEKLSNQS